MARTITIDTSSYNEPELVIQEGEVKSVETPYVVPKEAWDSFYQKISEIDTIRINLKKLERTSNLTKENLIKEFDKKINNAKNKTIESLGIFVALFTFISVEFQIFKEISNIWIYFSISCAVLGLLCWFILIMDHVLNQRRSTFSYTQKFFLVVSLVLILIGGAFGVKGYETNKTIINKQTIEINQNMQSENSNSLRQ